MHSKDGPEAELIKGEWGEVKWALFVGGESKKVSCKSSEVITHRAW